MIYQQHVGCAMLFKAITLLHNMDVHEVTCPYLDYLMFKSIAVDTCLNYFNYLTRLFALDPQQLFLYFFAADIVAAASLRCYHSSVEGSLHYPLEMMVRKRSYFGASRFN